MERTFDRTCPSSSRRRRCRRRPCAPADRRTSLCLCCALHFLLPSCFLNLASTKGTLTSSPQALFRSRNAPSCDPSCSRNLPPASQGALPRAAPRRPSPPPPTRVTPPEPRATRQPGLAALVAGLLRPRSLSDAARPQIAARGASQPFLATLPQAPHLSKPPPPSKPKTCCPCGPSPSLPRPCCCWPPPPSPPRPSTLAWRSPAAPPCPPTPFLPSRPMPASGEPVRAWFGVCGPGERWEGGCCAAAQDLRPPRAIPSTRRLACPPLPPSLPLPLLPAPVPCTDGKTSVTRTQAADIACHLKPLLDRAAANDAAADATLTAVYQAWRQAFRPQVGTWKGVVRVGRCHVVVAVWAGCKA